MNTTAYKVALEITKNYLTDPVGYSPYEATNAADKQIIRQNNMILCLLEQIIIKLDDSQKSQPPPTNVSDDISKLVDKIDKLNLGTSSTTKKTPAKLPSKGKQIFGYR